MVCQPAIWFMEGVSSQKDILAAVQQIRAAGDHAFRIIASHRTDRPEILSEADYAYLEPAKSDELLAFMKRVIEKHQVKAIHAGKRGMLLEKMRAPIEALGVQLSTGAHSLDTFELADNKARFSEEMAARGFASVPSVQASRPAEVSDALVQLEAAQQLPCIKPVTGIYGMGFWILKRSASQLQALNNPDARIIHPDIFLTALTGAETAGETLPPQIVMPFLPGPEHSVDMLVEQGRVIAAVARSKNGSVQSLENQGSAYQLAVACAEALGADGLINVQTRNDHHGEPVLLEANLRPSGGIGYTLHSGINLAGLFALRQLGLINDDDTAAHLANFSPLKVISTHGVKPLPVSGLSALDDVSTQK